MLERTAHAEAGLSFLLLFLLAISRKFFKVKSSTPDLRWGGVRFGAALLVVAAYGVFGFWFLDPHQFGRNFHLGESIRQTFLFLSFAGGADLTPHTHYGRWFLDSLHFLGAVGVGYATGGRQVAQEESDVLELVSVCTGDTLLGRDVPVLQGNWNGVRIRTPTVKDRAALGPGRYFR